MTIVEGEQQILRATKQSKPKCLLSFKFQQNDECFTLGRYLRSQDLID